MADSVAGYLLIAGIVSAISVAIWARQGPNRRAKQYADQVTTTRAELAAAKEAAHRDVTAARLEVTLAQESAEAARKVLAEKSIQFPWLAAALADLDLVLAERAAWKLKTKKHPALKAAEEVKRLARLKREADISRRLAQYRVQYYEALVPWLPELVGRDLDDLPVSSDVDEAVSQDPAIGYLSEAEFKSLAPAARYQLALDRYNRPGGKSAWAAGREYERFIGWQYEQTGYDVEFFGAIKGLEDLGRDLICRRASQTLIVQCKRWSHHKTIHEKHVLQLFGTTFEYQYGGVQSEPLLLPEMQNCKGVLVTTTHLSEVAMRMANALGIEVRQGEQYRPWPQVKCNVGSGGEKIYHLPFDQQYDRIKIEPPKGEKYVSTVMEAEDMGFRRAFRWRGGMAVG